MTPDQREQLRLSILRVCDENPTEWGHNLALLHQMCRNEGRSWLQRDDVKTEIQYLEDKGFIVRGEKAISPELRVWRIHSGGRDYLAEH
jgi:hypothetical protein